LFVDIQGARAEQASIKVLRPKVHALIKRIEFVQKYAQDPLLSDLLAWCYAQKGCGKRRLAVWHKALIAFAAVAVLTAASGGMATYTSRRQRVAEAERLRQQQLQRRSASEANVVGGGAHGAGVNGNGQAVVQNLGQRQDPPVGQMPAPGAPGTGVVGGPDSMNQLHVGDVVQVDHIIVPEIEIGSIVKHRNVFFEVLSVRQTGYELQRLPYSMVIFNHFAFRQDWDVVSNYRIINHSDAMPIPGSFTVGSILQEQRSGRFWVVLECLSPTKFYVRSELLGGYYRDIASNFQQTSTRPFQGVPPVSADTYLHSGGPLMGGGAGEGVASGQGPREPEAERGVVALAGGGSGSAGGGVAPELENKLVAQISQSGLGYDECPVCAESLFQGGALLVCLECKNICGHYNYGNCKGFMFKHCSLCRAEVQFLVQWTPPAQQTAVPKAGVRVETGPVASVGAGLGGAPGLVSSATRAWWVNIGTQPASMDTSLPGLPKIILGVDSPLAIRLPNSEVPIFVRHNSTYAVELPGNTRGPRVIFSLPQDFLTQYDDCGRLRIVTRISIGDTPKAQFSLLDNTYYIV
jgi:hypothetical protein